MRVINNRADMNDTDHGNGVYRYDSSSPATFSINMNSMRTGVTYSDP